MKLLFVNACVRGEQSNTLKLCRAALDCVKARYPDAEITEVNLNLDRPQPLHPEQMEERSRLRAQKDFSHPMFTYAKEFAAADRVIIGAPYWDLSFPSVLKIYLELICVVDITFAYSEEGQPYGLCKAKKLLYISTAGGPVEVPYNMGYDYIKGLCNVFYGISDVQCFMIPGLEMGGDEAAIIREGTENLREFMTGW